MRSKRLFGDGCIGERDIEGRRNCVVYAVPIGVDIKEARHAVGSGSVVRNARAKRIKVRSQGCFDSGVHGDGWDASICVRWVLAEDQEVIVAVERAISNDEGVHSVDQALTACRTNEVVHAIAVAINDSSGSVGHAVRIFFELRADVDAGDIQGANGVAIMLQAQLVRNNQVVCCGSLEHALDERSVEVCEQTTQAKDSLARCTGTIIAVAGCFVYAQRKGSAILYVCWERLAIEEHAERTVADQTCKDGIEFICCIYIIARWEAVRHIAVAKQCGEGFLHQHQQVILECIRIILNRDRKSTRLNSSHVAISYAVFCLKKKKNIKMKITN